MKVKVERSRVDSRWCVYSSTRETLCPLWAIPIVFIITWINAKMTDSTEELLRANETMYKTIVELKRENKMLKDEILKISNSPEITSGGIKADLRELLWKVVKK